MDMDMDKHRYTRHPLRLLVLPQAQVLVQEVIHIHKHRCTPNPFSVFPQAQVVVLVVVELLHLNRTPDPRYRTHRRLLMMAEVHCPPQIPDRMYIAATVETIATIKPPSQEFFKNIKTPEHITRREQYNVKNVVLRSLKNTI